MDQKLAKRLDHNIKRIKDETVKQLLVDVKAASVEDGRVIQELREANERLINTGNEVQPDEEVVETVPEEDKNALGQMMEMTVLMERAGFIGIMETYKSAKYRFPDCVTASRGEGGKAGEIISIQVELDDGMTVTLRSPECVNPDEPLPTSVSVIATTNDQKSD